MRFTQYMWYLVMLEGGKLIPFLTRVIFKPHAHFLERGFKHYIQHFVLIDVGFWHLLSGFFTYAQAAFWEGHF